MKKQESKHGRRGQSETRSPGAESRTSLPKPLPKIIFQQDFPKPSRPGHKVRSRPSVLKPPAEGLRPSKKPEPTPETPEPPPEKPQPAPQKPQPVPEKPQAAPQKPQPATPAVPAGSGPTAPSQPKPPAKAKVPEPEPSIWEKIFPCLKKEKPAPKEPLEKHLVAVAPPPKGPYEKTTLMVGDTRAISTVPSPPLPEEPKKKPPSRKKREKRKASSAHISVPKTVFSIFDPVKEPAEVYIQEPSKLPKGILKTSEERVQTSKSVSIILPSEMDQAEIPPEGVVKSSKTHFKSPEVSQVTSESSVQSLPQERKPTSAPPDRAKEKEEKSSEEEEESPRPISLKSQKKAPLFARTNVPPKRKANTKDSATQTVPPVEAVKPASPLLSLLQSPSPTSTTPQPTEKMACRLPAAHFQLEMAPSYIPPPKHGRPPPPSTKAEDETEPDKPPKPGARGAPLPGAKWVHKFLF
ncbi:uncharacterized protein LOC117675896 [Pantherophis guttatus]|uniref:Uncharacterized protein LOC117675896 n=1 Tax=Pantherophis guttatus TaxID=94885 RepID=A0A6P9D5A3_PANGU|nr:uncharacterized protein LOC117675896 [Pantherophis guttatus]